MKTYYLSIVLCFLLLASCSSSVKTNTLKGVGVSETEIEVLPVAADLVVSDQKVTGEATGKITEIDFLTQEALAKALFQEQPSVNGPDALVGQQAFTEVSGAKLKVTLTGYPAYYINFRTATETDSMRLAMYAPSTENKPQIGAMQSGGDWYYSIKYQFGDGFGWGIGAGKVYPSELLRGDIFFGIEIEEMGFISPWKSDGEWYDSEDKGEWVGLGASLNAGGIYGELPNDIKLVYGLSAGFWYSEFSWYYNQPYCYDSYWGTSCSTSYVDIYEDHANVMLGPFVKARWHGLEAGFRFLTGTDSEAQFAIGYTF